MSPTLEAKLLRLVLRLEEYLSPRGYVFDLKTLKTLLMDKDVQAWKASLVKKGTK